MGHRRNKSRAKKRKENNPTKADSLKIKKEQELQRKKTNDNDTAKLYKEFVASFSIKSTSTSFVKSGYLNNLKKPINSHIQPSPNTKNDKRSNKNSSKHSKKSDKKSDKIFKKKTSKTNIINKRKKKKTVKNIDLVMQELKMNTFNNDKNINLRKEKHSITIPTIGNVQLSTNLYISNLPLNITEVALLKEFYQYGKIGNVKIIRPINTGIDRKRNTNYGFVNFMKHSDANRCMELLRNEIIFGNRLIINWGRPMPTPTFPLPMPLVKKNENNDIKIIPENAPRINVRIPSEKIEIDVINLTALYVSKEGYALEQCIAQLHKNDLKFKFLFEVESDSHFFYRWRLHSLSQGDSLNDWRESAYQIIEKGYYWIPPKISILGSTSVNKLVSWNRPINIESSELRKKVRKTLSEDDKNHLIEILNKLTKNRYDIKMAMGFCIEHSIHAVDVVRIITKSIIENGNEINNFISKMFLISDILHNCNVAVRNSSAYRTEFQKKLEIIIKNVHSKFLAIHGRITAVKIKEDVFNLLKVWSSWSVYPEDYIENLKGIFEPRKKVVKKEIIKNKSNDKDKEDNKHNGSVSESEDEDGEAIVSIEGVMLDEILPVLS